MEYPLRDMAFFVSMDRRIIPPVPNYVALQRENLWALVTFMQARGLTTRTLATSVDGIGDDFKLMPSDLSQAGIAFFEAARNAMEIQFDADLDKARDQKRFERVLKRTSGGATVTKKTKAAAKKVVAAEPTTASKVAADTGAKTAKRPKAAGSGDKFDDAKWHAEGSFPVDLPASASGTHTGMFVAWALFVGLGADDFADDFTAEIGALRARKVTPGEFYLKTCGGRFTDEMLSDEGCAFAREYFDFKSGQYLADYEKTLAETVKTLYHVPDTWASFDKLEPVLDDRLAAWRED